MKTAVSILLWTIRITGTIQIVLGMAFWTNNLYSLLPVHMLIGLLLVVALWVLAVLAARMGAGIRLVALSLVWGLIVPVFGIMQTQLLPGEAHWVVEVVHLLIGLVAMGLGGVLANASKQKPEPALAA